MTAASKEKVLNTLGEAASKLRGELGESLATVQRFDVPLAQATTSSLEALKAYSLGGNADNIGGPAAALPHFQRALELDPNFAMANDLAGVAYLNLGQPGRANEYLTKAFQLREHASEHERLRIAADYYVAVTGELDKQAKSLQELIEIFPRGTLQENLGVVYASQGQYEKAVEITRPALNIEPNKVGLYDNLANYGLALQRFDEARQVIHQARARNLDDYLLHNALYGLAFVGGDSAAMAEQQAWFAAKPEWENFGLALASDTEAYVGHLGKARELSRRALDSAVRADSKETGATWGEIAAQREAAYGKPEKARETAAAALKLSPTSQGVEVEAALAYAMAGEIDRAESIAQELNKRYPVDTQMQFLWLPAVRAQLALDRKNSAEALDDLQVASTPIEYGQIGFVINLSCLYPTYIRGEAYLVAGQNGAAAAEFQKILDHSGIVWNCWTGALAHLQIGRAYAMQGDTAKAKAAYQDFLTLWKDADPDIPIFIAAKAEYAKLQ